MALKIGYFQKNESVNRKNDTPRSIPITHIEDKMAIWTALPNELVKTVLSNPEVNCDVRREIGKEMGWNLIGKVRIPDGLEEKLAHVFAGRVEEVIQRGWVRRYRSANPYAPIKLTIEQMPGYMDSYMLKVNKDCGKAIFYQVFKIRDRDWQMDVVEVGGK